MIIPFDGGAFERPGVAMERVDLAGAAHLELVSGVAQLRPEDGMFDAMLRGWQAQQKARGLHDDTVQGRDQLVRRFLQFTNEYPWHWSPAHVDEWMLSLTGERHLAPATIRAYQTTLRLFSEFITDRRYGWIAACEEAFGTFPTPICHEWNTIVHLNDYEGSPEARPFTLAEVQRFFDFADEQVDRAARVKRKGALAAYRDATVFGLRRRSRCRVERPVKPPARNRHRSCFTPPLKPTTPRGVAHVVEMRQLRPGVPYISPQLDLAGGMPSLDFSGSSRHSVGR